MIVADTNLLAYLWIPSARKRRAAAVLDADPRWAAPLLWRSEFRNVLAASLRRGLITLEGCIGIMHRVEDWMSGREYAIDSDHVLRLVGTSRASSYDCEYVALAQHLDVPLVTSDRRLQRAFPEVAVSLGEFLG